MSVKVDLDQLSDSLGDYSFAYLVTVGDDHRAHTVAVDPVFADGVLDVGTVGGHTRRNVAQHSDVTLLWPPRDPDGYTLIVDGVGQVPVTEDRSMRIVPNRAVLHRKATAESAATANGCLHDCVPLEEG